MPDNYHLPAHWPSRCFCCRHLFSSICAFAILAPSSGSSAFCLRSSAWLQFYNLGWWNFSDTVVHPWIAAVGQTSILISSALFLASLSPLSFPHRTRPYPLCHSIHHSARCIRLPHLRRVRRQDSCRISVPDLPCSFAHSLSLPDARGLSLSAAFLGLSRSSSASRLAPLVSGFVFASGGVWPLIFVECAIHSVTALLIFYVFRRISAGTVLAGLGFLAWSLNIGQTLPFFHYGEPNLWAIRVIAMAKIVAAIGMILLTLEDQLAANQTGQIRERHAREEMEAYTRLDLARRRVEDFDRQSSSICQSIVSNSRFQAGRPHPAARLRPLPPCPVPPVSTMPRPMPWKRSLPASLSPGFLDPGSSPSAVEHSLAFSLDLSPFLVPGDDLTRLKLTTVQAIPLRGRASTEGAIFLTGVENPADPVSAVDLLPLEVLASRLQSVRGQTMMLEKLVEAEKFVGLGQLAGNVTRQLNNPLTVILGYASLLDETEDLNPQAHKAIEAILNEARHMRLTLESLARMSRPQGDPIAAISVTELLNDLEQLHRSEFVQRSIDFRVHIAPALPRGRRQRPAGPTGCALLPPVRHGRRRKTRHHE